MPYIVEMPRNEESGEKEEVEKKMEIERGNDVNKEGIAIGIMNLRLKRSAEKMQENENGIKLKRMKVR